MRLASQPRLRIVAIGIVLLAACPVAANAGSVAAPLRDQQAAIATAVTEASQRFGVPTAWIWEVIHVESRGDIGAVSSAGAMGLMQIMPRTYGDLRARYALGLDPFAVRDNILAGTAYLRELHDRYGAYGMLAAYNAGPGRWEDHLATGRPLPGETQRYLARLAPAIVPGSATVQTPVVTTARLLPSAAPIFVARNALTGSDANPMPNRQPAASEPRGDRLPDTSAMSRQRTADMIGARAAIRTRQPTPRSGELFVGTAVATSTAAPR